MSRTVFLLDLKRCSEMEKFLKHKGYEVEYDFKDNAIYPEYIKSGDSTIFFIKDRYIYISKSVGGGTNQRLAVKKGYSFASEWKEYMRLNGEYLGKKNVSLKKEYEKAKKEYQEMCKRNDKVYTLLKRNFEYKEGDEEKENRAQKEEKRGFFGKLFGG